MPRLVAELLACWKEHFESYHSGEIWNVVPLHYVLNLEKEECSNLLRVVSYPR